MNRFSKFAALSTLSAVLFSGVAIAQDDHHDNQAAADAHHQSYVKHDEWKKGYTMNPPRGYEWREVDGNYVLAAVATGIIASAIIAAASH